MADSFVDKWVTRIKLMLGGSRILALKEINDDEILEAINIAYEKISPFITDDALITKPYNNVIDLSEDGVEEVRKIIPGERLSYVPSADTYVYAGSYYGEMLFDFQSYRRVASIVEPTAILSKAATPDVYIPFRWDADNKLCYLAEGYTTGPVTLEVTRTVPLSQLKDDRAKQWIFSYALALCKEIVGRIRSKAKSSNIPVENDGDTLLSEASSEKATLEGALSSEQFGPTVILR